ncbi:MAG: thioredoxin [Sediminibacterium sp.]|jgi:thioredoxin 1|nr:thioredoxin [Sediminibacterium sp.]
MSNTETFGTIIKGDKPVLVDFFATWCGPCKMMQPILEQVSKQLGDEVRIVKIDVDKNQQLASQLQVSSVPTLAIFKNGEIVWRQPGVQPAHVLSEKLKSFM